MCVAAPSIKLLASEVIGNEINSGPKFLAKFLEPGIIKLEGIK